MAYQKPATLLTPCTLGDLELKNRVFMAPLTRGRCDEQLSIPEAHSVEYYKQRASVGLIISEGTLISKQAHGWQGAPGVYTPEQVAGWKKVTSAVHEAGGKIFCQLWHMGRVTHTDFFGLKPVSASAIAAAGDVHVNGFKKVPYEVPEPLTLDGIAQVIAEFKQAAANAKEAGFDGVELHGANGYLLDQFTQSSTNKRDDAYGGSAENRFRLSRQVIEAVSTVFPAHRIGYRVSPNGVFGSMGSADNIETFTYVLQELRKLGVGYVHVMDGLAFGSHGLCRSFTLHNAKTAFGGFVIGNCGYTPLVAEGAIGSGAADAIAFGRLCISNPDLVARLENGWPLAESPSYDKWYRQQGDDQSKNLIDFPTYKPE